MEDMECKEGHERFSKNIKTLQEFIKQKIQVNRKIQINGGFSVNGSPYELIVVIGDFPNI